MSCCISPLVFLCCMGLVEAGGKGMSRSHWRLGFLFGAILLARLLDVVRRRRRRIAADPPASPPAPRRRRWGNLSVQQHGHVAAFTFNPEAPEFVPLLARSATSLEERRENSPGFCSWCGVWMPCPCSERPYYIREASPARQGVEEVDGEDGVSSQPASCDDEHTIVLGVVQAALDAFPEEFDDAMALVEEELASRGIDSAAFASLIEDRFEVAASRFWDAFDASNGGGALPEEAFAPLIGSGDVDDVVSSGTWDHDDASSGDGCDLYTEAFM